MAITILLNICILTTSILSSSSLKKGDFCFQNHMPLTNQDFL